MIPSVISDLLAGAPTVAFSGGRQFPRGVGKRLPSEIASYVPSSSRVVIGCAKGVDQSFRRLFPQASVFHASHFGEGRSSFARRSVAVIDQLDRGDLFVSLPDKECPRLMPSASSSRCFCGSGSGSWASLAYAIGRDIPAAAYLGELRCPAGWALKSAGGGWFLFRPSSYQLSLGL